MTGNNLETESANPVQKEPDIEIRMEDALRRCHAAGERVSLSRRRTLELVLRADGPVKAYDLAQCFHGTASASVITVYRALDFWGRMGMVRRIETLNAFVATAHPDRETVSAFLLCVECGATQEVPLSNAADVGRAAGEQGFRITSLSIEAGGTCRACAAQRVLINEVEG